MLKYDALDKSGHDGYIKEEIFKQVDSSYESISRKIHTTLVIKRILPVQ